MTIKGFEDWISLGGKTRQYKNQRTGEVISRWEFDKRRLGATRRQIAKESKKADATKFYSAPARGRKSSRKLAPEVREEIREAFQAIEREDTRKKGVKKVQRKLAKKTKLKKPRPSTLKKGNAAFRMAFDDAEQLDEILDDAAAQYVNVNGERKPFIIAYAIGLRGYDERHPERGELDVTTQNLTDLRSRKLRPDQDDLEGYEMEVMEEKPYFVPTGYWVHLKISSAYLNNKRGKTSGTRPKAR